MPFPRQLAVFLLLMGSVASSSAADPAITPALPTDTDAITLTTHVDPGGKRLCDLHLPVQTTVTRDGAHVHVAYFVEARRPDSPAWPETQACPSTAAPVPVVADLGTLPAGNYQAVVVGVTLGQPNPLQRLSFQVRGEGFVENVTVTPQPATPDDALTLVAHVPTHGALGCDMQMPFETSLTRTGDTTFQLDYRIRAWMPGSPPVYCVLVPAPTVSLTVSLGTLPPGIYLVKVDGSTLGQPNPTQMVMFEVSGGSTGGTAPAPRFVPANGFWTLVSTMCALVLYGVWRMRRF